MQLALKRHDVRRWMTAHPWVLEAGGLWLGQHVIIIGLVVFFELVLASTGIPAASGGPLINGHPMTPDAIYGHSLLDPFMSWDAWWYVHIAHVGYDTVTATAFAPLYPLLEALLAPLFGSAVVAGLMLANVAGLGACLLLRVVLDPVIGPRTSQRTLFYLLYFPTAVFFLCAYTESFYLLLSLAVFAALQRRAFWWAGIFAGLGVMTHYTGAVLVCPLLIALYQARAVWWRYLSAAIAPLLLGGFWVFLALRFHELPATTLSRDWGRTLTWPWAGVAQSVAYLTMGGHSFSSMQSTARDLLLTLVLLALTVAVLRMRLPLIFKGYTVAFVLFALANPVLFPGNYDALFSVPRYLLPIFPLFISLAQLSLRSRGTQLALFATTLLVSVYMLPYLASGVLIA